MKLAFNGKAHYADFSEGYELYRRRTKKGNCVDRKLYGRIIRSYCKLLAKRLEDDGIIDLPHGMGSIGAATITRKAQYRGDKFIGYGKYDWDTGLFDGKLKTFGFVFLPNREWNNNMRCFGFVANRRLFKRIKENYINDNCGWKPIEFNDDMI